MLRIVFIYIVYLLILNLVFNTLLADKYVCTICTIAYNYTYVERTQFKVKRVCVCVCRFRKYLFVYQL